jgi:hypothetical protein
MQLEAYERDDRKPSKLQGVVTVIDRMKEFVTLAASQEPHAAVAWAALSLLLPVTLHDLPGFPSPNQVAL